MRYSRKFTLLFILAALMLAACGAADAPGNAAEFSSEADDPQTTVELDVFSGLPNPVWSLSDDQTLELVRLLGDLPECDRPVSRFDGLGYRGFLVSLVAPESRTVTMLRAASGVVELGDDAGKTCYLDADHQVEKWLLESGHGILSEELYTEIWDTLNK